MGQQELIDFFKANKDEWFSTTQIAEHMESGRSSVVNCLKKIRDQGEIVYKYEKDNTRYRYFYKYKKPGDII